jgi:hypothetical protein
MSKEVRSARNAVESSLNIALDAGLHLVSLRLRVTAVCGGRSAFASQADVGVIADSLLREALENLVLLGSEALNPLRHDFQHLSLDLGVRVMEVRMEARINGGSVKLVR